MYFNLDFKWLVLFFLFLFLVFIVFGQYKIFFRLIYPFFYREIIYREAVDNGFDPYLVAAIIYTESKFNSQATSSRGARGLMQIMPATGDWIAQKLGADDFSAELLYDPEVNISYGCWYLSWLDDKFYGHLPLVLAAYNGGQGNVDRWLEAEQWDGRAETIDQIPLVETRDYVRKVLDLYNRYQSIYD